MASRHRRQDRVAIASDGLAAEDSIPSASVGGQILKARLRAELSAQARIRLPITYAALAERIVVPVTMSAIRDALEQLMDDDADDTLPFLGAIAVRTGGPGLPAAWFFRKAGSIGRFAGDAADVEAYAFHAREFHRAIAFHARSSFYGQGSGNAC